MLLILTAVKINSQKASIYFRHTCYQHLVRRLTHKNFIKMEALNNKKNQERVNNRVAFSNGEIRRPEYLRAMPIYFLSPNAQYLSDNPLYPFQNKKHR